MVWDNIQSRSQCIGSLFWGLLSNYVLFVTNKQQWIILDHFNCLIQIGTTSRSINQVYGTYQRNSVVHLRQHFPASCNCWPWIQYQTGISKWRPMVETSLKIPINSKHSFWLPDVYNLKVTFDVASPSSKFSLSVTWITYPFLAQVWLAGVGTDYQHYHVGSNRIQWLHCAIGLVPSHGILSSCQPVIIYAWPSSGCAG